jgi:hypothetical protein
MMMVAGILLAPAAAPAPVVSRAAPGIVFRIAIAAPSEWNFLSVIKVQVRGEMEDSLKATVSDTECDFEVGSLQLRSTPIECREAWELSSLPVL